MRDDLHPLARKVDGLPKVIFPPALQSVSTIGTSVHRMGQDDIRRCRASALAPFACCLRGDVARAGELAFTYPTSTSGTKSRGACAQRLKL